MSYPYVVYEKHASLFTITTAAAAPSKRRRSERPGGFWLQNSRTTALFSVLFLLPETAFTYTFCMHWISTNRKSCLPKIFSSALGKKAGPIDFVPISFHFVSPFSSFSFCSLHSFFIAGWRRKRRWKINHMKYHSGCDDLYLQSHSQCVFVTNWWQTAIARCAWNSKLAMMWRGWERKRGFAATEFRISFMNNFWIINIVCCCFGFLVSIIFDNLSYFINSNISCTYTNGIDGVERVGEAQSNLGWPAFKSSEAIIFLEVNKIIRIHGIPIREQNKLIKNSFEKFQFKMLSRKWFSCFQWARSTPSLVHRE